jgi:transcriptional regulator with XRE-family HTH domain
MPVADDDLRAKWKWENRLSGEQLREIRKQAGLTQKQAATALGFGKTGWTFVSGMERGERGVPLHLTDQIMALVPLDDEPDSDVADRAREVAAPRGPYGRRSAS